jgi:hypothetical protein
MKHAVLLQLLLVMCCEAATITRGPYLQVGTPSSMVIRWRTDVATTSVVNYGTSVSNLDMTETDANATTEHVVKLSNLQSNTQYFYAIGSTDGILQGDGDNFFYTSPTSGSTKSTRIWVTGDCGNNSTNQVNVRDKYYNFAGSNVTDLWLLLGDNAYDNGTDAEYQTKFFNIYQAKALKQYVLWPAPGNHDYANNSTRQNRPQCALLQHFLHAHHWRGGWFCFQQERILFVRLCQCSFLSLRFLWKRKC